VDAFDADVLIYAAVPGHPEGDRVAGLFRAANGKTAGTGSVLLVPEVLSKPLRDGNATEARALAGLLARLDLRPAGRAIAGLAAVIGAKYDLRAADAIHLATAVAMGAKRFITNNRRDFSVSISEIEITYPGDLASAA
jgi:predicted nucleic acid-binding protein